MKLVLYCSGLVALAISYCALLPLAVAQPSDAAIKPYGDPSSVHMRISSMRAKLGQLGYDAGTDFDTSESSRQTQSGSSVTVATKDLKLEQAIRSFEQAEHLRILSPLLGVEGPRGPEPIFTVINLNPAPTSKLEVALDSALRRRSSVGNPAAGANAMAERDSRKGISLTVTPWMTSVEEAYQRAIREDKFLLVMFLSEDCKMCDEFETIESNSEGLRKLSDCMVLAYASPDDNAADTLADKFSIEEFPTSLLIVPNPTMMHSVGRTEGYASYVSYPNVLRNHMRKAAAERQPYVPKRFLARNASFCE